jgi:hypothetical protein
MTSAEKQWKNVLTTLGIVVALAVFSLFHAFVPFGGLHIYSKIKDFRKQSVQWREQGRCEWCGSPGVERHWSLENYGGNWSVFTCSKHAEIDHRPGGNNIDYFWVLLGVLVQGILFTGIGAEVANWKSSRNPCAAIVGGLMLLVIIHGFLLVHFHSYPFNEFGRAT